MDLQLAPPDGSQTSLELPRLLGHVPALEDDIEKVLISEDEIQSTVRRLGDEITRDYAGRDLLLVGVLKGAFVMMGDLSRHIRLPLEFDFMAVSSYGAATKTSGVVRILKDLDHEIEGRNVLLVEDIVDSGLTLAYLLKNLRTRRPASLEVGSVQRWDGRARFRMSLRMTLALCLSPSRSRERGRTERTTG